MRPEILFPLFAPVTRLDGVGPRIAAVIERIAGPHIIDLLWHLPSGIIDRRNTPKLADAIAGQVATLTVRIGTHSPPPNKRRPYRISATDDTGSITLVFFHGHADYLRKTLPEGEIRVLSGMLEDFGGSLQMTHPDHIGTLEDIDTICRIEPTYPLTTGLSQKVIGKIITKALTEAPKMTEWLDAAFISRQQWHGWHHSILKAHRPDSEDDLLPDQAARARLAYDELLANQLALALIRLNMRRTPGRGIKGDGRLRDLALAEFGYTLTASQQIALNEIIADMADDVRMIRLLQGDVGSGKTIVALLAMLNAVEAGCQAAIMAPTEILARQHLATIKPLADAAGVEAVLLTGREKGKNRKAILERFANGQTAIAIGTHAIFQDDVTFSDLGLAVVDEQHRFGVHQRLSIAAKGKSVDVMVMTATPIPRTLMLTAYGDMDVSRLVEKPANRTPVDTRVIPVERLEEVMTAIGRKTADGARAYWICPLIEDSDLIDLAAAEDRYNDLKKRFGDRVGIVHGRMKSAEKDAAMESFARGDINILVATTVVEVGIDIPEATIMVIEHAERFGLAQLHQLRGRIGRDDAPSTCLLVYAPPLGTNAEARLRIIRETDDGFRIADEDLKLRGAGELLGTRQSGMPDFRLADLTAHADLLATARDDAKLIIERDPELTSERGQAVRILLYLFERDVAVKYLRSG